MEIGRGKRRSKEVRGMEEKEKQKRTKKSKKEKEREKKNTKKSKKEQRLFFLECGRLCSKARS